MNFFFSDGKEATYVARNAVLTADGSKCCDCAFSAKNKKFLRDYVVPCAGNRYCLADGYIWSLRAHQQEKVATAQQLTAIFSLNDVLFGFDGQGFVSVDAKTGRQSKVQCDTQLISYNHINFQQQYSNVFAFCKGAQTHCYSVEFESKKRVQLRFVASGVSCIVNRYLCGPEYVYDMYTEKVHALDLRKPSDAPK